MIRRIFIVFILIVTSVLFINCNIMYAMGSQPPRKAILVRVQVVKPSASIELKIKGPYKVTNFDAVSILEEGENLRGRKISSQDVDGEGIKIFSRNKMRIYVNNRQFRGDIDIIKTDDNKIMVVNHIDIEDYLYGVLYHEVSHRWPIEVLKAQAIAARTYALYQRLVSKNKYFDLSSDAYSQVYGGRTSETWSTVRAVNVTQGLILTHEGKVFPTYFHATCGGQTSDASTLWNIGMPSLEGRVCNFCKHSPHYNWKKELTMDYVQKRIKEAGYNLNIDSIEILSRDPAGRILEISLVGKDGVVELDGNKFRLLMDPNVIRSTNFNIQRGGKYITFHGKGWGHGIGMCQWGAFGMAMQGWKAEEILGYYYPGAEIVRVE